MRVNFATRNYQYRLPPRSMGRISVTDIKVVFIWQSVVSMKGLSESMTFAPQVVKQRML